METAIERFAAISYFAVALSHILRPRGWSEFFAQLRAKGEPGAFIKGTIHMCFPAHSLRSMAQVHAEKSWKIAAAGAVMLPLSVAMYVASLR